MIKSRPGFTLVATTVMTAVALMLAGAMLQARSQWRSYSSLMIEKLVVEAAAEAEAQDFAHMIKASLKGSLTDIAEGDQVPTGIGREQLFSRSPFRRVEIRGGVSRTESTGEAPLLFDPPSQSEQSEMVASDVGMQPNIGSDDESLRLPVFWVPEGFGGVGEAPPKQIQLGVDDPYGSIYSRSSYAAVSSYSKPRKAFFSEGARVGFGNAVSIHARTFPVSAFTSMSFNSDIDTIYPNSGEDYGRIYLSGTARVGSGRFENITAMKGVHGSSEAGSLGSTTETSGDEDLYEQRFSRDAKGGEGGGALGRAGINFGGGGPHHEDDIEVSEVNIVEAIRSEGRGKIRGVVVSSSNGGMELVRNQYVDTVDSLSDQMRKHVDCDIEFEKVDKDSPEGVSRKTLAVKSGGLKLKVDTQKAVDTASLRVIDGGDDNYLTPEDLISGKWKRADGDGSGASAFYAETIPGTAAGKLYFNPCRLRFIGGDSAKGKPFSIRIFVPAGWALHIVTERGLGLDPQSLPGDGVTIITGRRDDSINLLGSFITSSASTPSMIVGQNILAKSWPEYSTDGQDISITSTIITKGKSPTQCILGDPSKIDSVRIVGSTVVWELQGNGQFLTSRPVAPPRGSDPDLLSQAYRDGLLSGAKAPALVPVVSEVRVNGNAPFTRRGILTAKLPSNAGTGSGAN